MLLGSVIDMKAATSGPRRTDGDSSLLTLSQTDARYVRSPSSFLFTSNTVLDPTIHKHGSHIQVKSSATSLTFPSATANAGLLYNLWNNQASSSITLSASAGNFYKNGSTVTILYQHETAVIQSDGFNWVFVSVEAQAYAIFPVIAQSYTTGGVQFSSAIVSRGAAVQLNNSQYLRLPRDGIYEFQLIINFSSVSNYSGRQTVQLYHASSVLGPYNPGLGHDNGISASCTGYTSWTYLFLYSTYDNSNDLWVYFDIICSPETTLDSQAVGYWSRLQIIQHS